MISKVTNFFMRIQYYRYYPPGIQLAVRGNQHFFIMSGNNIFILDSAVYILQIIKNNIIFKWQVHKKMKTTIFRNNEGADSQNQVSELSHPILEYFHLNLTRFSRF